MDNHLVLLIVLCVRYSVGYKPLFSVSDFMLYLDYLILPGLSSV